MEQGPKIRIVGRASEEKKKQIQSQMDNFLNDSNAYFDRRQIEKFKANERKKSKEEISFIDFANRETSLLMREAGLDPFNIPSENLHIISKSLYKKVSNKEIGPAFSLPEIRTIILNQSSLKNNPLKMASSILHEMLHAKAYISVESHNDGQTTSRFGLSVRSAQKEDKEGNKHEHFLGLHEAIVSETEKRLNKKLLDLPELRKYKNWLESEEAKKIKEEVIKEKNIKEEDIFWCEKDTKKCKVFPYPKQRKTFNYVCEEIQKQFPERFQDEEAVYKVFLNAHFTGRLLDLAHLVEDTFGKGSFRVLGNMDGTKSSGILHLETFKKFRVEKIKDEKDSNAQ